MRVDQLALYSSLLHSRTAPAFHLGNPSNWLLTVPTLSLTLAAPAPWGAMLMYFFRYDASTPSLKRPNLAGSGRR